MRGRETTHPAHTYFPGRFYLQFSCPNGSQQLARSKPKCFRRDIQKSSQEAFAWNEECYETMSTRGMLYTFKLNSKRSLVEERWPKLPRIKASGNTLLNCLYQDRLMLGNVPPLTVQLPALNLCFISPKKSHLTKKSLIAKYEASFIHSNAIVNIKEGRPPYSSVLGTLCSFFPMISALADDEQTSRFRHLPWACFCKPQHPRTLKSSGLCSCSHSL